MTRSHSGTAEARHRADNRLSAPRPQESTTHSVSSEEDLLSIRHAVRAATLHAGFGIVDQTRVVTAASELARNAYVHGGGGTLTIDIVRRLGTTGVRLTVKDEGPGIDDIEEAFADGFTTGAGLGHGLGGARRLMDDFTLDSAPGKGTVVTATRWNNRRAP